MPDGLPESDSSVGDIFGGATGRPLAALNLIKNDIANSVGGIVIVVVAGTAGAPNESLRASRKRTVILTAANMDSNMTFEPKGKTVFFFEKIKDRKFWHALQFHPECQHS